MSYDGLVRFEGIKNVDNIGKYTAHLDKDEIKLLEKAFIKAEFIKYTGSYLDKNRRDLPKTTIKYSGKKITYHKRKAPKKIIKLSQFIENKILRLEFSTITE